VRVLPIFSILLLGFVLGMRHATDPDHVVAVATIVSRERSLKAAAPIGMLWGLGHTATIVVVGFAIIVLGLVIPPRVGLGMEFSVSVMLMVLGAWNLSILRRDARRRATASPKSSDPDGHLHAHARLDRLEAWAGRSRGYRLARPLVVGVVHGLAGSAAVALLVLGTIRGAGWSVVYLMTFGVGTVAGMLLITTVMALPVVFSAARFERFHRGLVFASAAFSVGFGAFLAYEIGVVQGPFSSAPQWTPG
jgi:high-affinity nickel-transport protein